MQTYQFSVHDRHRNKTPREQYEHVDGALPWVVVNWTLIELSEHIHKGKAWACGITNNGKRKAEDIQGAQLVALDVDGDLSIEAFSKIPFALRHCIFLYTTPSHTPEVNRYRAVFDIGIIIEDRGVYRAIYDMVLEALGIRLHDNSGCTPDRLWYGNTEALIATPLAPGAAILPWEWIGIAEQTAAHEVQLLQESRLRAAETTDKDISRMDYLLRKILPPSKDGDYRDYWLRILACCAPYWDTLAASFHDWHSRGHQRKTQRLNNRRVARMKGQPNPAASLFGIADDRSPGWRDRMPANLQSTLIPPVIATSFSKAETASNDQYRTTPATGPIEFTGEKTPGEFNGNPSSQPQSKAPDSISPAALQSLKLSAVQDPRTEELTPDDTKEGEWKEALQQLYALRTEEIMIKDGLTHVPTRAELLKEDGRLLSVLMQSQYYARDVGRIDILLLHMLRDSLRLGSTTVRKPKFTKLNLNDIDAGAKFYINDWILENTDHLIYGAPGCGKTQFALQVIRALVGDPVLTEFLDSGPLQLAHHWNRKRALVIQSDMGDSAKDSTSAMFKSWGLADRPDLYENIIFCFENRTADDPHWKMNLSGLLLLHRTLAQAVADKLPYCVVMIDSMKACLPEGVEIGDATAMFYIEAVNEICRRHGATVIWVHHLAPDSKRIQGRARIAEAASALIRVSKHDKDPMITTINIEKLRGQGRSRQLNVMLMGRSYPMIATAGDIQGQEELEDVQTDRRVKALEKALEFHFRNYRIDNPSFGDAQLRTSYKGLTNKELAEALNNARLATSNSTLLRLIKTMLTHGSIERISSGKYTSYRIPLIHESDEQYTFTDSLTPDEEIF